MAAGAAAFQELEKQEFDLVLTDLRMQQVDGMQVLERTKELYAGHRGDHDHRLRHRDHRGRGDAEGGLPLHGQALQN